MIGDQRIDSGTGAATAFVPLWPYAIGFCLVVLFLEWWLYNRRAFL